MFIKGKQNNYYYHTKVVQQRHNMLSHQSLTKFGGQCVKELVVPLVMHLTNVFVHFTQFRHFLHCF